MRHSLHDSRKRLRNAAHRGIHGPKAEAVPTRGYPQARRQDERAGNLRRELRLPRPQGAREAARLGRKLLQNAPPPLDHQEDDVAERDDADAHEHEIDPGDRADFENIADDDRPDHRRNALPGARRAT